MPDFTVSNPLLKFEHQVLRDLGPLLLRRRWLVACSGGIDSMVLTEVIRRWRRRLCDRLVIAHVHHGLGQPHRDSAQRLVRAYARAWRLPFVTNHPVVTFARDEAALRELRFGHLERWRAKYGCAVIGLAHHRDDLLETRLLRLLRGTGPAGLVAMSPIDGVRVRPLLGVSRAEITAYARGRGLTWVEDPTNADVGSGVRAWLRHAWLPALDRKLPGARASLTRSLELLGQKTTSRPEPLPIARPEYARRDVPARERIVFEYLRDLGESRFRRAHVAEVVKRLDTRRKEFSFKLLDLNFSVTAHVWWASRVCE